MAMGIETRIIKQSLLCPYSLSRIRVPIRTAKCHHLCCFDLKSWISVEERNNFEGPHKNGMYTNCLVCNIEIKREEMFVDGFTKEILRSTGSDTNWVNLDISTGSWSVDDSLEQGMTDNDGSNNNRDNDNDKRRGKNGKENEAEIIDLTMLSDTDNYDQEKWEWIKVKPDPLKSILMENNRKRSFNVILLSSSSDDDAPRIIRDGSSIGNAIVVE
jgi:hypothetical protein